MLLDQNPNKAGRTPLFRVAKGAIQSSQIASFRQEAQSDVAKWW